MVPRPRASATRAKAPLCDLTRLVIASLLSASILTPARAEPADAGVDLALMLAVDVSESVDPQEAVMQRQGYVQAIRTPDVVDAILAGPQGRIALSYVEWAGQDHYFVIIDWSVIDSPETASAFAARLDREVITKGYTTSLSTLMRRARMAFEQLPLRAERRVLDISGDGPNNDGGYIVHARDRLTRAGVTINGLPISNDRPAPSGYPRLENLPEYYGNCVIGGAGAFQIAAESFEAFAAAIRRKLVREIAGSPPGFRAPLLRLAKAIPEYDCSIGEKQSRERIRENFETTGGGRRRTGETP